MAKYSILHAFYKSDAWVRLRLYLIASRGNRCSECGEIIARPIEIIGHHVTELTPENVGDHSISLNPELIRLVCFDCHQKLHSRFGYEPARNVFVVYGPPFAGKKTYVREHMHRGDMVVDMDRLYAAVSMLPCYDKPDNLFTNVIGLYNMLIDNIRTRFGKWNSAWVIAGLADKYKRERLADDLGAELVFCDVSMEECLRRLEMDEDRRFRKDEYKRYIERWFEQYSA